MSMSNLPPVLVATGKRLSLIAFSLLLIIGFIFHPISVPSNFPINDASAEPFGLPVNVSEGDGTPDQTVVATSGSNVYVVWGFDGGIGPADDHIFFSRSTDFGTTFEAPIDVSDGGVGTG